MDWLKFISNMTDALAWPITTIVVCLVFKKELGKLVDGVKLSRIKGGQFQAEFESTAKEIRNDLPKIGTSAKTPSSLTSIKDLDNLIENAPHEAISRIWVRLEGQINSLAARNKITRSHLPETLNSLVTIGYFQTSTADTILGLQKMRNLAIHAPLGKIAPKQAREFKSMTEATLSMINQKSDSTSN